MMRAPHWARRSGFAVAMFVLGIVSFAPRASSSNAAAARIAADPFLKRPYLIYTGEPTKMEIHWQLDSTATAAVLWGVDASHLAGSTQTAEYGTSHQHKLLLDRLHPGRTYYYHVIAAGKNYTGSFTAAPPPTATRLKFMAYGDTRADADAHDQVALRMAEGWNADPEYRTFVLVTGDIVDDGDDEEDWNDDLFNPEYEHVQRLLGQVPFLSAMGNHDGDGELFTQYLPYPFAGDGRYWSFDYGPAHFVIIDQYTDYSPGSPQFEWIASDLAATTKPWKFLCFHEPGWSAGGSHGNTSDVQDYLQPLCQQYGVAIVFAGHNHYYAHAVVNGVHHVTTGGGGAKLHEPDDAPSDNVVTAASVYHYCAIDIDGDRLQLKAIGADGTLIDSFTIHGFPTSLTLSGFTALAGSDHVDLRWTAVLDAPATMQVQRSAQASGGFVPVSELFPIAPGHHDLAWRDASVQSGTVYYYRIAWQEDMDWQTSSSIRVMTTLPLFGIRAITPSPVRGQSRFDFALTQHGQARLEIFDVAGRKHSTLVDEVIAPGSRSVTWDGRGTDGQLLPSGVYFAKLTSLGAVSTRQFVLAR